MRDSTNTKCYAAPLATAAIACSYAGCLAAAESLLRMGITSPPAVFAILGGGLVAFPLVVIALVRRYAGDRLAWAKAMVLYLASAMGLILAEAVLQRLDAIRQGRPYLSNHPVLGEALTPNHTYTYPGYPARHRTDGDGIEIRPHVLPARGDSPGSSRPAVIMMLGDSVLQGRETPPEENVSVVLERELNAKLGLPSRVVNVGTAAWSPLSYLLAYRVFRQRVKPDAVVVAVFVLNDFFDDARRFHCGRIVFAPGGNPTAVRPTMDFASGLWWTAYGGFEYPRWRRPAADLRLLRLLRLRALHGMILGTLVGDLSRLDRRPEAGLVPPSWDFRTSAEMLVRNNIQSIFKDHYAAADREDVGRSLGYLARLDEEVRRDGRKLLLVAVPFAAQIEHQFLAGRKRAGMPDSPDWRLASEAPQELLRDFAKRRKAAFCDLLPVMRRHSDQQLFWPADEHFTPAGHRVAGEALSGEVAGLLKGRGAEKGQRQ